MSTPAVPVNPREFLLQFVATKVLADHAATLAGKLRDEGPNYMRPRESLVVESPLDGSEIALVTATNPKATAKIVDELEFGDWMREHHADQCEDVPIPIAPMGSILAALREYAPASLVDSLFTVDMRPASWAVNSILKRSAAAGKPVGPTDDEDAPVPPGIVVETPRHGLQVRAEADALDRVVDMWRASKVDPFRQLPAA